MGKRQPKKDAQSKRKDAIKKGRTKEGSPSTCIDCPALCCHDLAIFIHRPRTKSDIDDMKWHPQYDSVSVAIRHRRWYLVVGGKCIYLDDDNLCTIYDRRPERCRRHGAPDCERFGPWYDTLTATPGELDAYLAGAL